VDLLVVGSGEVLKTIPLRVYFPNRQTTSTSSVKNMMSGMFQTACTACMWSGPNLHSKIGLKFKQDEDVWEFI
jgi:hypothetical protein